MSKVQRERCRNFLEEENETLLSLVEQSKHILENKKTDAVWAHQKRETWEKIATKFNSTTKTGPRNGLQLKLLYEGMKKKARQNLAADKVELYKTGGGSFTSSLSQLDERIVSANKEQFLHKTNVYDSNFDSSHRAGTSDTLNIVECDRLNLSRDTYNIEEYNEDLRLNDTYGEEETIHNYSTINETRNIATPKKISNQSEKQMRHQKHEAELAVLKASQEKYKAETENIKSENAIQLTIFKILKEKIWKR